MKKINVKDKLAELEFPVADIVLGDFDYIGEYTAKKTRDQNSELYKKVGCFFRPNYERGILIYHLIRRFEIKSVLEIGFGRGYAAFCAAKAMTDAGIDGKVYSCDPNFDEEFIKGLVAVFPKEWFDKLSLLRGGVDQAVNSLEGQQMELVYIDGDHRYAAVKHDWEMMKDRFTKFVLFDDYAESKQRDIEVKQLIDEIENEKELIISDRRIFFDDRRIADEDINYGQVLIKHSDFNTAEFLGEW